MTAMPAGSVGLILWLNLQTVRPFIFDHAEVPAARISNFRAIAVTCKSVKLREDHPQDRPDPRMSSSPRFLVLFSSLMYYAVMASSETIVWG